MSVRLSFGSRAGGSTDYQVDTKHNGSMRGQGHWARGPFDTIDSLTASLKLEIEAAQDSAVPDCTTVEFHLSLDCLLPLHRPTIGPYAEGGDCDLPSEFKNALPGDDGTTISDHSLSANAYSVINVADGHQRQIVQRAASRGIIAAVEGADGYRYSFNNAWTAKKDEEGSRFSYVCQDSMQNKDRHANGYTRTMKHLKGDGERGPRKPTYDCKGSISVKFSTSKQSVDVCYRHYAIHGTVAERKTLPRTQPLPQTWSPALMDGTPKETGGLAAALQAESKQAEQAEQHASSALRMVDQSLAKDLSLASHPEAANVARPLKRRRDWNPPPAAHPVRHPAAPLSLTDLLRQSETAKATPSQPEKPKNGRADLPPPVNYELPSWQVPPLLFHKAGQGHPAPYPPPYSQLKQPPYASGSAPPLPKPVQKQERPSSGLHSQVQGLFTTMKPIAKEWVVQTSYPAGKPGMAPHSSYNNFNSSSKAKSSCSNCRFGKKKCDEKRPQCGTCVKNDRNDCIYEGSVADQAPATWRQPP